VIEENLAVEIRFREAIGAWIELLAIARRFDPERVQIGVESERVGNRGLPGAVRPR